MMMVGEVTGSGHVCQTLSSCSLLEADMVCKEPVADILTVRHDVPEVAGSPIRRSSGETDGVGSALYYEVISVIRTVGRLNIVREILGRTGVILFFEMDTLGFPQILMIHCRRLCSVASCFGITGFC